MARVLGDRAGLSAFDSRPRLVGRPVAGASAFPAIRRMAAAVDYSTEETNFTLGLSAVGGVLDRRALGGGLTALAAPPRAPRLRRPG